MGGEAVGKSLHSWRWGGRGDAGCWDGEGLRLLEEPSLAGHCWG